MPVSSNGCIGQPFTVTATINPEPVVVDQTSPVCSDSATGVSLNLSSSVIASTYNITAINPNGLTPSAGNPVVGTNLAVNVIADDAWTNITPLPVNVEYNVVPVSAAGCQGNPFKVTITVNPEPVVIDQTSTICSDVANGVILGNDLDTPLATTYNITSINSNGLLPFAGSPAIGDGLAANIIADDAWTNTTPAAVNVVYTVVPVSTGGCKGNPFTVTITVESTLGVGPQTVTACSDAPIGFILGAAPSTTYNITAINQNGLTASAGTPVIGNNLAANEIADDAWTNETALPVTVVYTVLPVSSNGCIGQPFTVTATINPEPVVADQSQTICSDSASGVSLNLSSSVIASTYNITAINPNGLTPSAGNPVIGNNLAVNVIADDAWTNITPLPVNVEYNVVPVSAAGCQGNPFKVTITVNPEPVVIDQTSTICSDVANGVILGNDLDTPLATTYNITSINSNGLLPFAGSPAIGDGLAANIIADDAWTNTTPAAVNVVYTVVPVSTGGCKGNPFTVTITVESELIISNQSRVVCSDTTNGLILGSEPTATYSITNIVSNGLIASAGTPQVGSGFLANEIANDAWTNETILPVTVIYTVTPQTSSGCTGNPVDITLTINPEPNVVDQSQLVCSDEPSNLILGDDIDGPNASTYNIIGINTNGLTPFAGNPQLGSGFLANEIADDAWTNTTLLPVDVIYKIIPVSASGCKGDEFSVTLTINPQINISYDPNTLEISCYGANDAYIELTVTGGTGPYIINWIELLGFGLNQYNLAAGDYTIKVTDSEGCSKTIIVPIIEAPIFTINPVVVPVSCFGANNGSINLNLIGGFQSVSVSWSDGSNSGLVRNNLGPGTYTVTIVDSKPCIIEETFIIVEPLPLVLSANVTNAFACTNGSSGAIDLIVSGGNQGYTYLWTPNGAITQDLINITAGNYAVTVIDSKGCRNSAQYSIERRAPIEINVTTQTIHDCDAHTVVQSFVAQASGGMPGYSYQWSNGQTGPVLNTTIDGMYQLTVTDSYGCSETETVIVDIPVLGYASFDTTSFAYSTYGYYSIKDPIQFTNTATGDYVSIIWDFGDGTYSADLNPVHTFINPKDYVVTQTVTYPFGCVYVNKITFVVEKGYLLVVPNAFTPNNDLLNDTFRPVTKALYNLRLDVYDTLGSMIYSETGDVLKGWDGKIKGQNAENGNYYCKVSGETFYETTITENHPFILLK